MHNYFIQEIWMTKITLLNVLYWIILEIVGVGITLALMQDDKSGDPHFFF